ncbi:TPA: hypothetical protein ACV5TU_000419 [Salmonella enterica]
MKLYEMEGFLRGKCIPGNMKVNETNAEYLVRKFSEADSEITHLKKKLSVINSLMEAAEQANKLAQEATEKLVQERNALAAENAGLKDLARGWANATDDRLFEEHGEIFHDSIDACEEDLKTICPATDAFLAEVRAQGVEMFAKQTGESDQGNGLMKAISRRAIKFASQLRKGVQS